MPASAIFRLENQNWFSIESEFLFPADQLQFKEAEVGRSLEILAKFNQKDLVLLCQTPFSSFLGFIQENGSVSGYEKLAQAGKLEIKLLPFPKEIKQIIVRDGTFFFFWGTFPP